MKIAIVKENGQLLYKTEIASTVITEKSIILLDEKRNVISNVPFSQECVIVEQEEVKEVAKEEIINIINDKS